MNLILASSSPRRKEILSSNGYEYQVCPADIDETFDESLSPFENVKRVALKKCKKVFETNPNSVILAADTIVVLGKKVLGKPKTADNAILMLKELSGKTHEVMTGVAVISKDMVDNFVVVSKVTFNNLTEEEIIDYVATKEPLDKAGAYAIQGIGKKLISEFIGEFENIMGLPIKEVKEVLNKHM